MSIRAGVMAFCWFEAGSLPRGLYVVRAQSASGATATRPVVLSR